jgi:hypothetical protein
MTQAWQATGRDTLITTDIVFGWRIRDKVSGRWRKLTWKMTEAEAQAWAVAEGHPEIEKLKWSRATRPRDGGSSGAA